MLAKLLSRIFPVREDLTGFRRLIALSIGGIRINYGNLILKVYPISLLDRFVIAGININPFFVSAVRQYAHNKIVIDIGANHGVLSLLAVRNGAGHCIAFEPSLRECAKLTDNIRLNSVDNITLINAGLAERHPSLEDFFLNEESNPGKNSFYMKNTKNCVKRKSLLTSFDIFFSDSVFLSDVRVVKIDCEGFEINVLRGMVNSIEKMSEAVFVVEMGPLNESSSNAIYEWFLSKGFEAVYGEKNLACVDMEEVFFNPKKQPRPVFSANLT